MERQPPHRQQQPDQRSLEARTRAEGGENERFFILAARPQPPGRRFESNLDQLNELLADGWWVTDVTRPEVSDEDGGPITGWVVLLRREGGG